MSSETDPTPCNQGFLADVAALASQLDNPVAPYPAFFASPQCGRTGGPVFPVYFNPITCPAAGLASPQDNCLRVISQETFQGYQSSGANLASTEVNVLANPDNDSNSVFTSTAARLYSWYVPPGYALYFYKDNPVTNGIKGNLGLRQGPDTLQTNACANQVTLDDGTTTFFSYANGATDCDASALTHNSPYFVVVLEQDFHDLLVDICTADRQVEIGVGNTLNKVWQPQSAGCDSFMTTLCSGASSNATGRVCACFRQQQALNVEYGASLEVPVCCFGVDPSGDISRACLFDQEAYKTSQMLRNCCSFAECQSIVEKSPSMQANTNTPGKIECRGQFVNFPSVTTTSVPLPNSAVSQKASIPGWVWGVLAAAVAVLMAFVVSLSFVLRTPKPPLLKPLVQPIPQSQMRTVPVAATPLF